MSSLRTKLRIGAFVLLLAGIGAGAYFALRWYRNVPLERVLVTGNVNAEAARIEELAALDTVTFVFDADPAIVSDRVRRDPWVHDAEVTRWPTGTLEIAVTERVPVLLAIDDAGRPRNYVDAEGRTMPLADSVSYDVPLLHGVRWTGHWMKPVSDERVKSLAADLGQLEEAELALASGFEVRGREVWLRTAATLSGQSIEVRLGRDGFGEKMRRLHAFWHQAVLTQPDTHFERVDLRFDSQIVTREAPVGGAGSKMN